MTAQSQAVTWTSGAIAVAWAGVIFVLLALPLAHLWQGLGADDLNPGSWRALLLDPAWIAQVAGSLIIAVLAATIAAALALPAAIVIDRAPAPFKLLAWGFAVAVFTAPLDVLATALVAATAELAGSLAGSLAWPDSVGTVASLGLIHGVRFASLLLVILAIALHYRDRGQGEAALCHGIGPMTAWFRFTLPQLAPALILGVVWIGLYALNDTTLPTLLGVDPLLATTVLPRPDSDTGASSANQATLTLVLLGLMTIVLAWRALVFPTNSDLSQSPTTAAPPRGIGLPSLLLGVVALMTSWAWHGPATAASTTLVPPLEPMLAAGAWLALLGGAAAILARRIDPFSRFVRQSLPLLLLLPPLLVLNALTPLAGIAASTGITTQQAQALVSGLALIAPWLILTAYFGRHLAMLTSSGIANLAESCGGPTRTTPRRIALAGMVQLIIGLFCFGAALATIAMNQPATAPLPPWDIAQ